jgi:hypothetical protein
MTINNSRNHGINRGIELMLRKKGGEKKTKLESRFFSFDKVFSLFNREIYLQIRLDIMKK